MDETGTEARERIDAVGRGNPTSQWEVFYRDEPGETLSHVGSVAAESATEAHEHASSLFGRDGVDVWLCPAADVARFSTRGLEPSRSEHRSDGTPRVSDA
ncbi:Htur_1727 family rSAM-partnered candidate RiPP [Natronolimnohabitans innermongolicus]|uniref:Phenylacetic acid degradation B n=1 Tax=Natronolimnohabitans innermongolicus JCM 12255 TaxID=1227499 RepID=L9XL37_9EURY|nr:Htur_1727 family rSAM-partnered candidate RiPP [Natronolimnohabitans innermongolicus]ELY62101.1 hypothetical protein C493_00760 [Natronolimnohabitans innermongolicus JCM 12255]